MPLLGPARKALEEWRRRGNGYGLVFPSVRGEGHRNGYQCNLKRCLTRAGIDRHVRFHDLRHTCGTHLVQGSWGRVWSLYEVRDMLGHSTVTTTERYAHMAPEVCTGLPLKRRLSGDKLRTAAASRSWMGIRLNVRNAAREKWAREPPRRCSGWQPIMTIHSKRANLPRWGLNEPAMVSSASRAPPR
ncbi:tyrosine-type recombinase/integrase [Endomicrobium sp. AH-315-J14]|nr:tyrosine-type recombinase/integrase [Endomicrobium sp. AH-315-J14]